MKIVGYIVLLGTMHVSFCAQDKRIHLGPKCHAYVESLVLFGFLHACEPHVSDEARKLFEQQTASAVPYLEDSQNYTDTRSQFLHIFAYIAHEVC